jgi:nucleoside-diphosphate-sugar epimerase
VRPFGLYGPYDRDDKFVPQVIRACLAGASLDVTGGEQVRDYTHADDAARFFVKLVEMSIFPVGEIVNLASGQPVQLREIGQMVTELMNAPHLLRWGVQPYRPDELRSLMANVDKADRLLGWRPMKELRQGLVETIRWYKEQAMACDRTTL